MPAAPGSDDALRASIRALDQPVRPGAPATVGLGAAARARAGASVHARIGYLRGLGLTAESVANVLGAEPDAEAYFEARAAGRHVFGPDGRCEVCGAARAWPAGRCDG